MSEQERFDRELSLSAADAGMERSLRQLVPVRPALAATDVLAAAVRRADAARRSARRQAWIWRGVAAGLAASLALTLWMHHGTTALPPGQSATRGVDAPAKPAHVAFTADEGASSPDCSYLILRQRVLSCGMAGLPDAPSAPDRSLPLPGEGSLRDRRLGDGDGT